MFFEARIYSKKYVSTIHGRFRNKGLHSREESEKRISKKFKKEKKLIYAFFLDIA